MSAKPQKTAAAKKVARAARDGTAARAEDQVGGRLRKDADQGSVLSNGKPVGRENYTGDDRDFIATVAQNCSALRKAFRKWPVDWLIELFERHQGEALMPARHFLNARDSVDHLAHMAALGNEDAVADLASLAVGISQFLNALVGDNDDATQNLVDEENLIHREIPSNDSKADDYRLLLETQDGLMKINKAAFQGIYERMTKGRVGSLLPGAIGMLRVENLQPLEDSSSPGERTGAAEDDLQMTRLLETTRRQRHVDYLLASMFEKRLEGPSREAVRKVLGRSDRWPIVMDLRTGKGTRETEEQILGATSVGGLTYRLPLPKSGNDTIRNFANHIFTELEHERRKWSDLSPRVREEWKRTDDGEAPARQAVKRGGSDYTEDALQVLLPPRSCLRKAALLPPPDVVDLKCWVEAGMAYLEAYIFNSTFRELLNDHPAAEQFIGARILLESEVALCVECRKNKSETEKRAAYDAAMARRDGNQGCEACLELREQKRNEYKVWQTARVDLLRMALVQLDDDFQHHPWPDFIRKRAQNRAATLRQSIREKLTEAFRSNLNRATNGTAKRRSKGGEKDTLAAGGVDGIYL